ncbi:MAG TPA: hypothetical protein VHE34_30965 [Puia sp.]|uniref:hypothetical protein n=1 Tax=Puia sp. TaxID=2045100 RepID=UPI002C79E453|nr:hypothetical protein [Puia sp.]HVU99698.1 hypothetical protein [Puia sp.]
MSDKIESKENALPAEPSTAKSTEGKAGEPKQVKRGRGYSALVAASMGRSATGAVRANAVGDISGASDGTANTGIIVTYGEENPE